MRKLIIAVLVLISLDSFAQPTNYTWYKQRIRQTSLMLDSMLYIPRYNGTPSGVRANENSAIDGAIAVDTANGRQYFYYNGSWRRLANYSELGVDSIWREAGKDSIFYSKGGSTYKIKDSTGGGGSYTFSTPLIDNAGTVGINGLSSYGTSGQLPRSTGSAWQYFNPRYADSTIRFGDGYKDSSDIVVFRKLNTNQTTINNGWANFSGYSTYVTETPSATGLRMVSTRTTYNYNSSVPLDTSWESAYNDVRIQIDFVLNSKGSSLPYIGTVMDGATNLYANNGFFVISLLDSSITFLTSSFGNFSCGTMARNIAAWDSIRLVHRRYFDVDYLTVYNFTNNTVETFNHSYGGSQSGCATTNIYPGLFIADMDITLKDYVFYGKGFQPDVLIVGASIQQNQMDVTDYDSSYAGRLNNLSGRKIGISAKCGNNLSDFQSNLREIRALKPKSVLLGDLGYNEIYVSAEAATVWQPKYRAFIDSLISIGTRVVIMRQTPNPANVIPDTLNAFIDSVYSNHPKVQILDIYTLVDFYHPDSTNKAKASYFRDGIHWNNKPSKSVADRVRNQLERVERFNITGGTDVNFTRLNNSILLYQNTGTTKGQWNSFKLGSGLTIAGDSISSGGGSPGGVNKKIQYNSSGSFAGAGNMTREMGATEYLQLEEQSFSYGNDPLLKIRASHGVIGLKLEGFADHTPVIQLTDATGGYDYRIGGLLDGSFNFFEMGSYSSRINLGVYGGTKRFSVQARADAPSGNSVEIFSGTAGSTGLVITGASGQTANLLEIKNSTPSNLAVITATGSFDLYNGTAPTSSVTNGIRLYSEDVTASAELKVRDEAGNITTLSPHNFGKIPGGRSEKLAWSFYSQRNGEYITADMTKALRTIENQSSEIEELKRQVAELKGLIYEMKAPVKLIHTGKVK